MFSKATYVICCAAIIVFSGFIISPLVKSKDIQKRKGPYLDNRFPMVLQPEGQFRLVNAFPNLKFADPTDMAQLPGTNKFLVAGKNGHIWIIENDSAALATHVALDITDRVNRYSDQGLLSIALHPQFLNASSRHYRQIYLYYTWSPNNIETKVPIYNRLSRFKFSASLDSIHKNSEEILIQHYDRHQWHNGGSIFFDENEFLYLAVGDEGGNNDFYGNTQRIDKSFFSGILRIDPNMDTFRSHAIRRLPQLPAEKPDSLPGNLNQHYLIPNDNPWIDASGGVLEEFFAIGLRSPHRISYDAQTKNIWVADVGEDSREEISIFSKGSNGQWAFKEGYKDGPKAKPGELIGIETPPVFEYNREHGIAVIGGFVYRGSKYSSVYGKYIFGDLGTGNIWTLTPENNEVILLGNLPGGRLVSFFTDSSGEIFVIKYQDGGPGTGMIYRIKDLETKIEPPTLLSETGAFSDLATLTPSDGIIPYDVNNPLWSEGAVKYRWIALPENESGIKYFENSSWIFPKGTVFIKHFEFPGNEDGSGRPKRLETRFLVIDDNGGVYGVTYKWNEEGTDAVLVGRTSDLSEEVQYLDKGLKLKTKRWDYPTRSACLTCHNSNAGFVLGVSTEQLNKSVLYENSQLKQNQMIVWNDLGYFSSPIDKSAIDKLPKLFSLNDPTASDEQKVRSYLSSNCSFCHRPSGVQAAFDARFSTPLQEQKIISEVPIAHSSSSENFIVKPYDLFRSELWLRDAALGDKAMPPLAKNSLDEDYLNILSRWILNMDTTVTAVERPVAGTKLKILTTVYPVPFKEVLNVKVQLNDKTIDRATLRVLDGEGRIVYQNFDVALNENLQIIGSDWSPGIYFVETIVGSINKRAKTIHN